MVKAYRKQLKDKGGNYVYPVVPGVVRTLDEQTAVTPGAWVTPDMLVKNGTSFWSTYSLGKVSGENVVTKITTLNGFDEYIWQRNGGHIWCLAKGVMHDPTNVHCVRVSTSFYLTASVTAKLGVFGIANGNIYSSYIGTVNGSAVNLTPSFTTEGPVSTTIDGSTVTSYYGTAIDNLGTNVNGGIITYTAKRIYGTAWMINGQLRVKDSNTSVAFEVQCTAISNDVVPSLWIRGVLESNLTSCRHVIEIFED